MKSFIRGILTIIAAALLISTAYGEDKCYTCHKAIDDKPSSQFKTDIHFQKGISCAGCHGGDASKEDQDKAMDSTAGFKGVPHGDDISARCASCHANSGKMKSFGSALPTNQWENLQASVHGKLALSGKEHVAQCITCHGAHGIVSVKNPASPVYPLNVVKTCSKCHSDAAFMRDYNPALPVDQVEKYHTSIHGMRNAKGDPKTAECASCHGSHDIRSAKDVKSAVYAVNLPSTCARCHGDAKYMEEYKIPTDQYAKFSQSVHGMALLQKHDVAAPACNDCHGNHGAAPPGVESVSKVCGSCHALNADLFSSSPHKKAFDDAGLPECETCHSNHDIVHATDKLLGVDEGATCSQCHQAGESSKGFTTAKAMRSMIDSLEAGEQQAAAVVEDAEQKGMEVSEAKFKLRDAHQARLQSRTAVHAFNEAKFREVVNVGMKVASTVTSEGNAAVEEYYFRRWGLGVATLIISVVALALYFAIKRIEKRQRNTH
ncbi:MAG TPA: multiheme c-type cytochrome [Bacteroidota bacterium]|nr:multiheme c-type cytochrome [Bacteroidota bacterium]